MQQTSATWKALVARLISPDYTPGTQTLAIYSGNGEIYRTGEGQRIQLYSGGQMVFDSDVRQSVRVYSGRTVIYESGHLNEYGDSVYLKAVAEIGGTTYDDLPVAPVVNRALMQGGLSVGNAVSASCALSIRTGNSIPRAAEVLLKVRLTDGVTTSEWLPAGTFYISRRSVDPVTGILSLECYDALLKANALWELAEGDLPMSMADAAEALAGLLGVELDGRNDIATGAAYVIDSLSEGETIRDTLARIAVANGGNWIITPANRLRLVPLLDAADASTATADALDVGGVTGGISVHPASTVTGIRYGGEEGAILGDDTGTVIDIGENAAFLQPLFDQLVGLTFRPFDLAGAVYDPAAELGDYVRAGAGGEVASVLHSEVAAYGPGFTGNLSAPQGGELADEYPYIGGAANKALLAARAYARQISEALDHSLTQQEVFDRLTGNGAAQGLFLTQDGQLFINASYIYSGLLTLGGLNNENGTMRVLDASGNVICTLNNTGVDITEGSVATYSQDRLTRAILSDGQVSIQYWGRDGTGQSAWRNMLAVIGGYNGGSVRAGSGALTLQGQDAVHLTNRSGTTDTVYASLDMEDASVELYTWSAPGGAYEGDSSFEMGPESIKLAVGDELNSTDDHTLELSRNGLEANVKRVDVTATDGGLNFTATYTDLSGDEQTGAMTYSGLTLNVDGALNPSDPARTRANLGITPENLNVSLAFNGTWTLEDMYPIMARVAVPGSAMLWLSPDNVGLLSGDKVRAWCTAIASRTNASSWRFMAFTGASEVYTWTLSGWSGASATPTIGTVYKLTGTAI